MPAAALAAAPPDLPSPALLDWLRAAGHLTGYQAAKLLRGDGRALLVGPYRLLHPLARGGMGMVYLAAEQAGGPVAVKLLSPTRAAREPQLVARFRREQHVGTRLPAHPHLVRQLDYGLGRGVEFLVLGYLPGRTVRQKLAAGPLTVGAACRVFADVAAGLHAAHTAGVVHRDLKPSNVLVGPTGRGTVLDFGLALLAGEPGDPRVVGGPRVTVGTLDYLPPEQAANAGAVGPAADLYSFGGSLFTALTGRLPFADAAGTAGKVQAHRNVLPPLVSDFCPDVPDALADLVRRLLAKHPALRPESAAEVAAELENWADPPVPAPPARPLAEVVAEVEAAWAGRDDPDRAVSVTVAAAIDSPAVRLRPWHAYLLAAAVFGLALLAAWLGRRLA